MLNLKYNSTRNEMDWWTLSKKTWMRRKDDNEAIRHHNIYRWWPLTKIISSFSSDEMRLWMWTGWKSPLRFYCREREKMLIAYLDAVVASSHSPILYFHVCWRVCKFALSVRSGTFISLELSANFQLEPTGVLNVQQVVHVHIDHSHIVHIIHTLLSLFKKYFLRCINVLS